MRAEVQKVFDKFIEDTFKEKREICKYLLNHERKGICIDNICEQIQIVERRNYKITFNVTEYQKLITSMAHFFCQAAIELAAQRNMSESQKHRVQAAADEDKSNEEHIREMVKDGLIIDNDAQGLKLGDADGGQKTRSKET